jgi:hypothetical protein
VSEENMSSSFVRFEKQQQEFSTSRPLRSPRSRRLTCSARALWPTCRRKRTSKVFSPFFWRATGSGLKLYQRPVNLRRRMGWINVARELQESRMPHSQASGDAGGGWNAGRHSSPNRRVIRLKGDLNAHYCRPEDRRPSGRAESAN